MNAIYTCITNDYDKIRTPKFVNPQVDYILFTDDPNLKHPFWDVRYIKDANQREIKILPHKFLPEYEATLWVDGNMVMKGNMKEFFMSAKDFITVKHDKRDNIYDEGEAIIRMNKAKAKDVQKQLDFYRSKNFVLKQLYATGLMFRRNNERVNEICNKWWEQVSKFTHRDQLALPYVAKGIHTLSVSARNKFVRILPHKTKQRPVVHYISPFRSDKNIGLANNMEIEKYDSNDWVCLTDADAMPMTSDYGTQVEEIIMQHGHEYGLIGGITNRIGGLHQCWEGEFSNDMDARSNYMKALEARERYGNSVEETSGVAGFCMIFKVSTWKEVGGFKENTITADSDFNKRVRGHGYKIGIAKGLYFFHLYRVMEDTHQGAFTNKKHLE